MLAYVATHIADGQALLLSQFAGKPRITGWLAALLGQVQELEDAIWAVYVGRQLPTAVGVQLDVLGSLVGQTRSGATDAAFATYIGARVRVNQSDGRLEDLITVAAMLLPTPLLVRETYPKSVDIEVVNPVTAVDPHVVWAQFLEHAKSAGTSVRLIYSPLAATSTVTWGDVGNWDTVFGVHQWWGSSTDTTTGGSWAAVAG